MKFKVIFHGRLNIKHARPCDMVRIYTAEDRRGAMKKAFADPSVYINHVISAEATT